MSHVDITVPFKDARPYHVLRRTTYNSSKIVSKGTLAYVRGPPIALGRISRKCAGIGDLMPEVYGYNFFKFRAKCDIRGPLPARPNDRWQIIGDPSRFSLIHPWPTWYLAQLCSQRDIAPGETVYVHDDEGELQIYCALQTIPARSSWLIPTRAGKPGGDTQYWADVTEVYWDDAKQVIQFCHEKEYP